MGSGCGALVLFASLTVFLVIFLHTGVRVVVLPSRLQVAPQPTLLGHAHQGGQLSSRSQRGKAAPDTMRSIQNGTDSAQTGLADRLLRGEDSAAAWLLIYNRVEKCGSTYVHKLMQELSRREERYLLYVSSVFRQHHLTTEQQAALAGGLWRLAALSGGPVLYDRHVHHVDFTRFGHDQPIYINVIRDPLERFVSQYHYDRHQRYDREDVLTPSQLNMSMNACVSGDREECTGADVTGYLTRWFCGMDDVCCSGSPAALALAKRHLSEAYVLVGVTADLPAFLWALEALLPDYFTGLSSLAAEKGNKRERQTSFKEELLPENRDKLKGLMKNDFELYDFVLQRFYATIKRLKDKDVHAGGGLGDVTSNGTRVTSPCVTESRELKELLKTLGFRREVCRSNRSTEMYRLKAM